MTMLFMLVTLAYTMGSAVVLENGAYYMGITIPKEHRSDEAVTNIRAQYKRSWRKITLIGLVTGLAIIIFYDYVSIQMVYIMTWFFVLMYVYQSSLKKYGWKLYKWKVEQVYDASQLYGGGHCARFDVHIGSTVA